MGKSIQARTLSVFGSVLIICSLLAILTIGYKSKNLLIVGSLAGIAAWVLAALTTRNKLQSWMPMAFAFLSCIVFAQRSLANLRAVIGIVQHDTAFDAYHKCTLIILLLLMTMASVSSLIILFVFQFNETQQTSTQE